MAAYYKKPVLVLSEEEQTMLRQISQSRTAQVRHAERARMILLDTEGLSVPRIAAQLHTNVPKVDRCIKKALQLGVKAALDDLQRSGRPADITPEAKARVVSLACQKPEEKPNIQTL
ncbi:helix-turn-helix domain-containing protein [Effusibacillus dendaii]|uniref:Helix-turn-helix domain-containing protein n=1 Tax=Effusibacillus dendaii TaxID=2743772 RepID=A0A7I8DB33_9BACL|nr:helix-turn-helix domain-containing protein [Effusibacillus dendaii]BCJ87305.1 hypothetical protein skT53_22900 [Effusibacillus dendaii]